MPSINTTIESRKCEPTSHGLRWYLTVIAPSGASASVPTNAPPATQRTQEGSGRANASSHVPSATNTATPETTRFENST